MLAHIVTIPGSACSCPHRVSHYTRDQPILAHVESLYPGSARSGSWLGLLLSLCGLITILPVPDRQSVWLSVGLSFHLCVFVCVMTYAFQFECISTDLSIIYVKTKIKQSCSLSILDGAVL